MVNLSKYRRIFWRWFISLNSVFRCTLAPIQALSLSHSLSVLHIRPLQFLLHSSFQSYSSSVSLHEIVSGQLFLKSTHKFPSWIEIWTLIWPHQVINTVVESHYCRNLASNLRSLSCLTTNVLPAHGVIWTPSFFFFFRFSLLIAVFLYPLHFSRACCREAD